MKIESLKIEGYKNLEKKELVDFDFTDSSNYIALIGLNGSGKSNVLEAVSIIFSSLYNNTTTDLSYEIDYHINDEKIRIVNGAMSFIDKADTILKKDYIKYLPTNVIASYSGEELRMWEGIYLNSYSDFFKDIKNQTAFVPKLLYINKYTWEFALIALLCSDNPVIKEFITNVLNIGEDVELKFTIDPNNYGLYQDNEALSFVKRLVSLQKETGSVHINTIRTLDINQTDNTDFTKKLFYYLFITGMPVKGEIIKADKIIKKTEISFNGIDIKKLSEGEKKLILIHTITNLLADDKTLILLDEPDAHVHIERKKEIIDIIDNSSSFTVLTTHSPKILHAINEKNIKIIKTTPAKGLEVMELDKIKALDEITNGEFSIIDATLGMSTTKDIILLEGKTDYKYISKALDVLEIADFEFVLFPCGGANNVVEVLKEVFIHSLQPNQLCFCLFDKDNQGIKGHEAVEKLADDTGKPNIIPTYHTKPNTWTGNFFVLEDYFPISYYKPFFENKIQLASNYSQISKLRDAKKVIEENFDNDTDFLSINFEGFRILFDEILEKQNNIHNPQP